MAGEMWQLQIRNDSTADVFIEDLGINVPAGDTIDFAEQFTYPEISESDDLRAAVGGGDLVLNGYDGDLSAADGLTYLEIVHIYYLEDNYYSKVELQTPGDSIVDWENIVNVPPFGFFTWGEPVQARVLKIQATPPANPSTYDFYVDTDDNHLYKWDGTAWVDSKLLVEGDRVIALDSTSENIFELTTGVWTDQGQSIDNDAVIVNNDGQELPALYVYEAEYLLAWVKIADSNFFATNTLDQAYDQGGPGAGREIFVDSGAVKLNASGGYAPLELTDLASAPTTGLADGQLAVINGLLYEYDDVRTKWLSVQRMFVAFGRRGGTKNQYLDFCAGVLSSNNSGYRIPRNATIVSLSGQLSQVGTGTLHIRKNDTATNITSLAIAAAQGTQDNTIDVNLSAGDWLQSYETSTAVVQDPMLIVEIAWRE
jgi:hypothetical protein